MKSQAKAYLVGAGPGDVELLTLKAVRVLSEADVILLDNLVNREVLKFARADAEIIDVGKRGGGSSLPQETIHGLMAKYLWRGKHVVRLKGGDPFVFGRGAEELSFLRAAGVEVEIVGGVTAGLAAAHAIGIPLTHRDFNHGVTLVTGHCCNGGDADWHHLAKAQTTLVVYMGRNNIPYIVRNLIEGGMSPQMPAAIVYSATMPEQVVVQAPLEKLAEVELQEFSDAPAVIVIGKVLNSQERTGHPRSREVPAVQVSDDVAVACSRGAPYFPVVVNLDGSSETTT